MSTTIRPTAPPPQSERSRGPIPASVACSASGVAGCQPRSIEGMLASSAPYLAVIDADLQHDERLLPQMLAAIKTEDFDVVVGSRHVAGGGVGEWDRRRVAISGIAARLARLIIAADLADPMSGFFMISRPAFERAVRHLSGQGFKILLDLFASTPTAYRFAEIPYVFRQRQYGESKLDSFVIWEYLMLLLDKLVGRYVPVRFVSFAAIGALGVAVHFLTLYFALKAVEFPVAQAAATIVAMTSNFAFNNFLTYRDRRLTGRRFVDRAAVVLRGVQPRRGGQCRHRLGGVCPSLHLVGVRTRRRRRRRCLELRRLLCLHLAPSVIPRSSPVFASDASNGGYRGNSSPPPRW